MSSYYVLDAEAERVHALVVTALQTGTDPYEAVSDATD